MVWIRKNKKFVPKGKRRQQWVRRKMIKAPPGVLLAKRQTYSNNFTKTGMMASAGSVSAYTDGYLTLTTSASVQNHFFTVTQAFCLHDLVATNEFKSLFEEYSLRKVIVKLTPIDTSSVNSTSNPTLNALLHYAIDHNDYYASSADENQIDELRQKPSYKMVNMLQNHGRQIKVVIKPHTQTDVYAGVGATGYRDNGIKTWLDTTEDLTEHYGLKMVFEVFNPSSYEHQLRYKWEATYYLALRGLK